MAYRIEIVVGKSFSVVDCDLSEETLKKVRKECSYMVEGAQFSPAFVNKKWDGRKCLFDAKNTFPTGLLPTVVKALGGYNKVSIVDKRGPVPDKEFVAQWKFPHELRNYQLTATARAVKETRGVLLIGTGGGKTVTASRIIYELGVKTLFIVNTIEALHDTVRCLKKCFPKEKKKIGIWGDGSKVIGEWITVATMSGVSACYHRTAKQIAKGFNAENIPNPFVVAGFKCIFIDECHHASSDTWTQVILNIPAYYKYGLTGTYFRNLGSKKSLKAVTGDVLFKKPVKELQSEGYLTKAVVRFVRITKPDRLQRPLEYDEVYDAGIVYNKYRNEIIQRLVRKYRGKSVLIAVEKVEHGEILLKMIKKVDPAAVFIHGKTKKRAELKKAFERKRIMTVIATRIYNESADVPVLDVVINASGGKSGIAVTQRVGRSLRLFVGKNKSYVIDLYDEFNYKLEDHTIERIKWLEKEGHTVKVVEVKKFLAK